MSGAPSIVGVTVIIPTFNRPDDLRQTLLMLGKCDPQPQETIVHIDSGDQVSQPMLEAEFPSVLVLKSNQRQGPGGGRNRLINHASNEVVVSLDDDSWPLDTSFFRTAADLMLQSPNVAVIACKIVEADEQSSLQIPTPEHRGDLKPSTTDSASFVGCGCIYRRSHFQQVDGYLRLAEAYGMEENDLALQLLDQGYDLQLCDDLVVFHNCDRQTHHAEPKINGAQIRNAALLAFLRYPVALWPFGLIQVLNRVRFSVKQRRFAGILRGLATIPMACWSHRKKRASVQAATVYLVRGRRLPTG